MAPSPKPTPPAPAPRSEPLRVDYRDAHEAAKRGDVKALLAHLTAQEIVYQDELGVGEAGEKRMPHLFRLIDQLRGYEVPSMGPQPGGSGGAVEAWIRLGQS